MKVEPRKIKQEPLKPDYLPEVPVMSLLSGAIEYLNPEDTEVTWKNYKVLSDLFADNMKINLKRRS